jgi:uncharacterized protein YdaU (DUF1376 family)
MGWQTITELFYHMKRKPKKMKIDSYMPFYGNDFFQAMAGRDETVICGYIKALWHYWHHTHCEGLDDDDEYLRRLCGVDTSKWARTRGVIFDGSKFFEKVNGKWHQLRAKEEHDSALKSYQEKVDRLRRNQTLKSSPDFNSPNQGVSESGSGSNNINTNTVVVSTTPWPREHFEAAARNLSVPDKERDACWAYYDSQGWRLGNNQPISGDPRSLLTRWLSRPQRERETVSGGDSTRTAGTPAKRERWKIEQDIEAAKKLRAKAGKNKPFGNSIESEQKMKLWAETDEGKEYHRLSARIREMTAELSRSI